MRTHRLVDVIEHIRASATPQRVYFLPSSKSYAVFSDDAVLLGCYSSVCEDLETAIRADLTTGVRQCEKQITHVGSTTDAHDIRTS